MKITSQQIVNPGVIEIDKKRYNKMAEFKESVKRAQFLNEQEKKNWNTLGYILTNEQLDEARNLIINEDLKRLKVKTQLEKLKNPSQKNG